MTESDSPISEPSDPPESPSQYYGRLRNRLVNIIKRNDLSELRQFIASYRPEDVIAPGEPYLPDTLWAAASYGSPEALRLILEVHKAAPEVVEEFKPKFRLLLDACSTANLDVVRFILDSHNSPENQLPLGSVDLHQRDDDCGDTPILMAAGSLMYLDDEVIDMVEEEDFDVSEWVEDRITRGHQLMHLLLDLGASATDDVYAWHAWRAGFAHPPPAQVRDSVLGLAVSRADGPLIQRLLDSGADIYLKHQHFFILGLSEFMTGRDHAFDVTALHLASLFYNSDAVKLLLDHQRSKNNANPYLASSRDSDGRLPLHWAANGPGYHHCRLQDKQLRITETLRLLLDHDSTGINLVDNTGYTPLHHAVIGHTDCGCSQHAELAIRTLLEYGADARIPASSGRTILHSLGYSSSKGDPVPTTLLDLILSHGADVNHAENNGRTALHAFARNLRQVSAAKLLIKRGADVRARDTFRETPFHTAAQGFFNDFVSRDGGDLKVITESRIRLQDEIMRALQEAAGEDAAMLMSQPNAEGKTPRDLLGETRNRWQRMWQPLPGAGRGRGRGRGIELPPGA